MWFSMKLAGTICILAASIMMGIQVDRGMKKKCTLLNEIYELLVFLEKEMTYHRAPIQEAFRCAAEKCTTELGLALKEAALQIDRREGKSFQKIWSEAVDTCIPTALLDGEERNALLDAAEALCNVDTVTQQTLLRKHSDRFDGMSRKEEEIYQEKSLLYRRLSAAAGAFLVIVLI
ncbi:MAG: stage III sporulation protein AB [Lachnospiraceae bacterium]|nr:stage III sporulation protein AB [Lachnospiraceae bacterium]